MIQSNGLMFKVNVYVLLSLLFSILRSNLTNQCYIFRDKALSIKGGKPNTGGINKRTSIVYFITQTMFKFYEKFNRFPSIDSKEQDISELKDLQSSVIQQLDLSENHTISEKLNTEKWWNNIFGEISPVCSIIGGIVGQDILRTISEKDTPLRNFVFFNGIKCNAFIENIGISS